MKREAQQMGPSAMRDHADFSWLMLMPDDHLHILRNAVRAYYIRGGAHGHRVPAEGALLDAIVEEHERRRAANIIEAAK